MIHAPHEPRRAVAAAAGVWCTAEEGPLVGGGSLALLRSADHVAASFRFGSCAGLVLW